MNTKIIDNYIIDQTIYFRFDSFITIKLKEKHVYEIFKRFN